MSVHLDIGSLITSVLSSNIKQVGHAAVTGKAQLGRVHDMEQYIRDDADTVAQKGWQKQKMRTFN